MWRRKLSIQSPKGERDMTTAVTTTRFPVLTETLLRGRLNSSGKMIAILGYIADVNVTEPRIAELCVTTDGLLMVRHDDEIGMEILGNAQDLERNLRGACDVLEIVGDEREAILTAVHHW